MKRKGSRQERKIHQDLLHAQSVPTQAKQGVLWHHITVPPTMASFNLFGKPKPKSKPGKPKTVADTMKVLDSSINQTEKRAEHLEKKIRSQLIEAKKKGKAGNKAGALLCLKRKKMYEAEVVKLRQMVMNLEAQKFAVESSAMNAVYVDTMKNNAQQMQEASKTLNMDDVADTMDDLQDEMQKGNDIQDMLSQQVGGDDIDEDELMGELDELEADIMEEEMMKGVEPVADQNPIDNISMPSIPDEKPAIDEGEQEEEAALAALEAEMGM